MEINLRENINESFIPAFKSTDRELLLYGGAGAGKSYAAAQKVIVYSLLYSDKKIVIVRKTLPALKLTCLDLLESLLEEYRIPYNLNKNDMILYTVNNNRIIFRSIGMGKEDIVKIKSLTDVDFIWIEEVTELNEREFELLDLRLRGKKLPAGHFRQIVLTFNPVDKNHWIYKNFFEKPNGKRLKFTYKDNKFIDEKYKEVLEGLKEKDENFYRIYTLGEWGTLKNKIYSNYVIKKFDYEPEWYDEVIAGVDFGYNNPSAYLLIGIKDDEVYIFDEIYKSHLLNSEFVDLILDKNKDWGINPFVYCETAEPDRIKEMGKAGLRVKEAKKDVISGINFVKTKRLHIHERCVNTIKEIQGYSYKEDRNGNVLEEPVKFNDHAMDALRYALYTHFRRHKVRVFYKKPYGL